MWLEIWKFERKEGKRNRDIYQKFTEKDQNIPSIKNVPLLSIRLCIDKANDYDSYCYLRTPRAHFWFLFSSSRHGGSSSQWSRKRSFEDDNKS